MHGEHLEDLSQHEPDALLFCTFEDLLRRQNVPRWDTLLVHDLEGLLDIVKALFLGSGGCIQAGKVEIRHVELEDVAE